jgi:hypothetical protein
MKMDQDLPAIDLAYGQGIDETEIDVDQKNQQRPHKEDFQGLPDRIALYTLQIHYTSPSYHILYFGFGLAAAPVRPTFRSNASLPKVNA